jgi:hypothetical protein
LGALYCTVVMLFDDYPGKPVESTCDPSFVIPGGGRVLTSDFPKYRLTPIPKSAL